MQQSIISSHDRKLIQFATESINQLEKYGLPGSRATYLQKKNKHYLRENTFLYESHSNTHTPRKNIHTPKNEELILHDLTTLNYSCS